MNMRSLAVLFASLCAASLCAETYWLDTSVGYHVGTRPNPLTNAYNWVAADGVTRAGAAGKPLPSDGIFYLRGEEPLGNGGRVRIQSTAPSSYTFGELHIGELSTSRSAHLLNYCTYRPITFNGVLYLEKGLFACNHGYDGVYTVNGDIRVKSPDSAPFLMAVGYARGSLTLKGKLSSDPGCTLKIGGFNGYNNADPANATYCFDNDLSGYYGTLWLHNDDKTPRVGSTAPHKFRFERPLTIPGSVTVDHDSLLNLPAIDTTMKIGTLSLGKDVMLRFAATDEGSSSLTVTNAFSHDGAVAVELAVTHGKEVGTVNHTLLTVPVENAFCMDDFVCTTVPASSSVLFSEGFSVVTNDTAGTCSLVYSYSYIPEGMIYLNPGDSGVKDNNQQAHYSSSLTNAAHWSDGRVPEAGKDYLVRPIDGNTRALRSLQRTWTDGEGRTGNDYSFPGDSLSILRGCTLALCADKMRFTKLRLYDGAIVQCASVYNLGVQRLIGENIEFVSGTVYLRQYYDNTFRLEGVVSGNGEICLDGASPTGNPRGHYYFTDADMTAFKGRIRVSNHSGNTKPDFGKTNQVFHVKEQSQLGGRLDAFDPAALILEKHGTLKAERTFDITAENNRGITVTGAGRIGVKEATDTLSIRTPLSVTGVLRKDEPGQLRLASALTVGSEEGMANVIELVKGTLRLAHVGAVDGMTLAVSKDTSIVVEIDPSDPERAAKGICMGKSATPFVLADGMDALPLTLAAAGTAPTDGQPFTHGLFTVTNDPTVVASVRAMLPPLSKCLYRGYSQELVEIDDADACTHTFAITFKKPGLVLSVR